MSVKYLNESDRPAWLDDEDEYSDFDDGEVREGGLFDSDGEEWEWLEAVSNVHHMDFDNWQAWSATNGSDTAYFVVDIDTGFIDWGPCETEDEAIEFLDSKQDDYDNLDESIETEDTVKKSNGKWTNRGKNGEHGEFSTKKAADAQRKAMYANGYKGEALYPVYMNSAEVGMSDDDCDPIDYIRAKSREDAEMILNKKFKSTRGTKYFLGDIIKESSHGDVVIGIYGDDTGTYYNLSALTGALKKAGIEILDQDGDEDYGWEMTLKGPAKTLFKMIDGHVPGYNCDDVQDFVDQYSIEELEESTMYEDTGRGRNHMLISVKSGIGGDGFRIIITNDRGDKQFDHDYAYGYDASYKRDWARKDMPYVSDIINNLANEYNIDRKDIQVVPGKNVFKDRDVKTDVVNDFVSNYVECTNPGSIPNAPAKHIRIFRDLDKKDESFKIDEAKMSRDLITFYKAVEELNRYTSKVLTQLRGDSDLKQYTVGAACVKVGEILDRMAQLRDVMD